MNHITLFSIGEPYFNTAWHLYETSFPKEERRVLEVQKTIMGYPAYNFEVILSGTEVIGIILWWGFKEIVFVEHFATSPELRGKGYGKTILQDFMDREKRQIILEVELPEPGIKLRRIAFYERLGFTLNTHTYIQPPMQKDCGAIPLYLMSYPEEFKEDAVASFMENFHPLIYDQGLL